MVSCALVGAGNSCQIFRKMLVLDHIVVAAECLAEGRIFVEDLLGVQMQTGGKHELMGTHNLLLGLEDDLYLEVISIDPSAPPLARKRWFGLDEFRGLPRVTNWVAQSDDLAGDMTVLFGDGASPILLSRGDLRWGMSVIDDGQTPFDGLAPMMLDWGAGPKAAERLTPSGCRLSQVILEHPEPSGLADALTGLLDDPRISIAQRDAPRVTAILQTPRGEVILS